MSNGAANRVGRPPALGTCTKPYPPLGLRPRPRRRALLAADHRGRVWEPFEGSHVDDVLYNAKEAAL